MDEIKFEFDLKFTDNFCYRFNSRMAVLMEKKREWKEAMAQWVYAMHQAKMHENRVWAYQRALYCRKQYIKSNMEADLSELHLPFMKENK